jgi:serine protease Do
VRIQDVTPDIAEGIDGLDEARGALVTDVPEGPAREAGMESGDVILVFDGQEIEDTRQLVRIVGNSPVGKTVRVTVLRDGKTQKLAVTLGRRETAEGAVPAAQPQEEAEPETLDLLGLTVSPITEELRGQLELSDQAQGLVVTDVDPTSEAYEKGLRAGDLIAEAGQEAVTTPAELEARIEETREAGRRSLLLLVRRAGEPRFLALSVDQEE